MGRKIRVGDLVVGRQYDTQDNITMVADSRLGLVVGVKRMGNDDIVTLLIESEIWTYPDCMLAHVDK